MVKALLHLPCSHLPRAVLADHKLFPFDIILLPSLPRGQPGHIVRLAVGLSDLPFSVFMLSRFLYWHLFTSSLPSPKLPLRPAWAYCPARRFTFSSPSPFFSFRLPLLFLPPLPPPSPSLFPLLPLLFHFSQGACPKWLCPKWQHPFCRPSPKWPFVAMLCFAATQERCSYAPPMPLAPTMPMHVVDHLLNVSWHSPHYFRAHVSYHLALLGFLAQSTSLVLISPLT